MIAHSEELICYCFRYTAADIHRDVAEHGHSRILKTIMAEKRQGHCQCATKNPSGR